MLSLPFRLLGVAAPNLREAIAKKITDAVANGFVQAVTWLIVAGLAFGGIGKLAAWQKPLPPKCETERLCILIAGLEGDADGLKSRSLSNDLRASLKATGVDIQIYELPRKIEASFGGEKEAIRQKAARRAERFLRQQRADVIIYGSLEDGGGLRLWVQPAGGKPQGGVVAYAKWETGLTLPDGFDKEVSAALSVSILASLDHDALAKELEGLNWSAIIARLGPISRNMPPSLSGEEKSQLYASYALALLERSFHEESLDDARLSIQFYELALRHTQRAADPFKWARRHNNLGNGYYQQYVLTYDWESLGKAIGNYNTYLSVYARDVDLIEWAVGQTNLWSAVEEQAATSLETAMLDQAIKGHRAALEAMTEAAAKAPTDKADVDRIIRRIRENLGQALQSRARRTNDEALMAAALEQQRTHVRLLRDAPRTTDEARREWRRANLNLAIGLVANAEIASNPASAEQAVVLLAALPPTPLGDDTKAIAALWAAVLGSDPGALDQALLRLRERRSAISREADEARWATLCDALAIGLTERWRRTQSAKDRVEAKANHGEVIGWYRDRDLVFRARRLETRLADLPA